LSNYYQIVMKFSGYLLLYEDTSAIDFGPKQSSALKKTGPEGGQYFHVRPPGACPAKGIDRSGPKPIALVSSYKRRYPENFMTIG